MMEPIDLAARYLRDARNWVSGSAGFAAGKYD